MLLGVDVHPLMEYRTRAKACCLQEVVNACLCDLDFRQTVIHFCASQNFVEFLQDLAELGASIDLADNKGK